MEDDKTLLALAEEFYEANTQVCDGLAGELKAAGAEDTALDDLVLDGADHGGRDSDEASSVNNQGFALQIACILEGNGVDVGARLVRAAAPSTAPRA
ncbi:hypothetical protein AX289_25120 [Methylorubrum populi]|nr:hypothetical protein AX289_25120 [Methylorubrum populi]